MIQMQVIDSLKQVAKKDPAVDATLTMFAARERARSQVTLRGLKQRMEAEGWDKFDDSDYKRVLKLLAEHGIGKLEKDSSGRVTALTEIKITLQSLGQAVLGGVRKGVEKWSPRNKYVPVKKPATPPAPPKVEEKRSVEPATTPHPMRRATDQAPLIDAAETLTVRYNGKPLVFQVPEGFTAQEIADFLVNLRSWRKQPSNGNQTGK